MRRYPSQKYRKNIIDSTPRIYWKRRPSEIRGYHRCLYCNLDNGDYIRIDYNLKDRRVRIYLEDSEEGGNPYYAVITDGKITAERNATTGRSVNLKEKISKRAEVIGSINNREILKIINKNYGIGLKKEEIEEIKRQRQKQIEETKRKYFKPEKINIQTKTATIKQSKTKIRIKDFVDLMIGCIIVYLIYFFTYDFSLAGLTCGILGLLIGFVDIFVRDRDTYLFKTLLFLMGGFFLYLYNLIV